jgi:hypothetical protein
MCPGRTQMAMAERVGFEPTIPLRVCRISSAVLSTTQPPLRTLLAAVLHNRRADDDWRHLLEASSTSASYVHRPPGRWRVLRDGGRKGKPPASGAPTGSKTSKRMLAGKAVPTSRAEERWQPFLRGRVTACMKLFRDPLVVLLIATAAASAFFFVYMAT